MFNSLYYSTINRKLTFIDTVMSTISQKNKNSFDGYSTSTLIQNKKYDMLCFSSFARKTIHKIAHLKDCWDGYNAKAISSVIIERALKLVDFISYEPQIYPTPRGTIQFEFYNKNDNYLEIEIFENNYIVTQITKTEESEYAETDIINFLRTIKAFYAE